MKKTFTSIAILFALTFVLTACNTSNTEESKDKTETANLYETIKKEGVLKIGTEGTYAPFSFHDGSGKLTGFDVEIAEEIAKRLDVKAEFLETQWDGIFAGLDAKRFDMIANQVGINEERQEKYSFSDPYIASSAVLIVADNNDDIKSFDDLNGKKSAQSLTSNYAEMATSHNAELVGVEGFSQAIELLKSNRVDATINDKLSFLDYKKQKPDAPIKIVDEEKDSSESGIMFRKGSDELVEKINAILKDMREDGTYKKISEKWFGEDVSPK